MLALPGLVLLVVTIYARPHEFVRQLAGIPLLYYAIGLAFFGIVLDVRMGLAQLRASPYTAVVAAFFTWAVLSGLAAAPGEVVARTLQFLIAISLFFVVSHGVQSLRAFQLLAVVLLSLGLFVSGVCVAQGFSSTGCIAYEGGSASSGVPDGRPCVDSQECYGGEAEPGRHYICEKIGPLGTSSINGRVRYLGVLQDPNEVALATGATLPFAFALRERRPTMARTLLLVASIVAVALCAIMTQSRGGQLVFVAVLAVYFASKYGARGLVGGALLALPLLLLGGRTGEEASQSTQERIEAWYEGLNMLRGNPLLGVGHQRFQDHHYLTAHNSFVLALGEMGLPGALLFVTMIYMSFKIPLAALRRYGHDRDAAVARAWALALLASMTGMAMGSFLLSFTYHYVLWIHMGLVSAFYAAVRRHDPEFRPDMRLRDWVGVGAITGGIIVALFVYTRLRPGG